MNRGMVLDKNIDVCFGCGDQETPVLYEHRPIASGDLKMSQASVVSPQKLWPSSQARKEEHTTSSLGKSNSKDDAREKAI